MVKVFEIVGVKDGRLSEMTCPSETAWFLIIMEAQRNMCDWHEGARLRLTNGTDVFSFKRDFFGMQAETVFDMFEYHGLRLWGSNEEIGVQVPPEEMNEWEMPEICEAIENYVARLKLAE